MPGQWEAVCIAVTLRGPELLASTIRELHIMDTTDLRQLIEAGFDAAVVKVESDDNTHFGALVVATEFAGKRPLARHQMVYKCLGTLVGNEIHALSITALTPEEWREQTAESR